MKSSFNSRTATRVKDGRVQPKNRKRPTGHDGYVIDRESAGRGYQHVITKEDLRAFIEIIPEWYRFSERLERIVLARPSEDLDGMHEFFHREETGAIHLHAWSSDLWTEMSPSYFVEHQRILERLGVVHDRREENVICYFNLPQARAFTLLHVFLHELGHHFDRIHQKHRSSSKGEDYAEKFANERFDQLFPHYISAFGDPSRSSK